MAAASSTTVRYCSLLLLVSLRIKPSFYVSYVQVSFVNSICTVKGGTHVNYIVDQITKCVHVASSPILAWRF